MEPKQVVELLVAAIGRHDWASFANLVTEDVEYINAVGTVIHGREMFVAYMNGSLGPGPFADEQITIRSVLQLGETAVVEDTLSGTWVNPIELPSGTIPPTGRRVNLERVWIARLKGDQIAYARVYGERTAALIQQLPHP